MELSKIWITYRKLMLATAGTLALTLLSVASYLSILATQPKQVTLTLDGNTQMYQTKAETVGQFLAEQNIPVSDKDVIEPAATTQVSDQLDIHLYTSWAVPVLIDGQSKMVHTVSRDVAGVIKDAGIALRPHDKVEPALSAAITKSTSIKVTRIDEKVLQVTENVPFQEIRKNDSTLKKGETRILQKGQPGKATAHYKVVLENGKEISRELVKRDVAVPKHDRIVAVGTAKAIAASSTKSKSAVIASALVSRGGKTFRVKRVLDGVTLTAYTPAGGGKSPKSAGYGRTATGMKASEGRTIAVDPGVIPLGWWVYIEGVGYRRAEDTGGAVNGHKIDVFFDSHSQAVQFGRKRNKTVYIIGPQKP